MNTCGLCGETLTPRGGGRVCCVDLCENCFNADPGGRLAHRGFEMFTERFTRVSHGSERTEVEHHLVVTGNLRRDFGVKVTFRREGFGTKIRKFFRKEVQTGDALFDDIVYVDGHADAWLESLVRNPDVQNVVLEFMSVPAIPSLDGPLLIADQMSTDGPPDEMELRRAMLIALHHFEAIALDFDPPKDF